MVLLRIGYVDMAKASNMDQQDNILGTTVLSRPRCLFFFCPSLVQEGFGYCVKSAKRKPLQWVKSVHLINLAGDVAHPEQECLWLLLGTCCLP